MKIASWLGGVPRDPRRTPDVQFAGIAHFSMRELVIRKQIANGHQILVATKEKGPAFLQALEK
ncbi:MAG: hypothetical protein OJI67_00225, partial [Prosthecobacter sp.]|nr:hypothetical protein [Prosthecobacter sp.]